MASPLRAPSSLMATRSHRLSALTVGFFTALGVALLVLGALFVLAPDLAEQSYGVSIKADSDVLHHVVGSREAFLGALLLVFTWQHRGRELAVVTLLSALVALADFWNVSTASDAGPAKALPHLVGFILLTVVGRRLWRDSADVPVASEDPHPGGRSAGS